MLINGKEVVWEKVSRDQLKQLIIGEGLPDSLIAQAFGVTKSQVRYKKTKYKLTGANIIYEKFISGNIEIFEGLNEKTKKWFFDYKNIDILSKSIANYIFRGGPIERLHHNSTSVSNEDMKE